MNLYWECLNLHLLLQVPNPPDWKILAPQILTTWGLNEADASPQLGRSISQGWAVHTVIVPMCVCELWGSHVQWAQPPQPCRAYAGLSTISERSSKVALLVSL